MKKTYFKGNRSGNYVQVKIDTDKLEDIQSALMAKFVTRVGILGSKTDRMATEKGNRIYGWGDTRTVVAGHKKSRTTQSTKTNAEIGLMHEKGSLSGGPGGTRIERRSFLEMPLVWKSEGLMAIRNKVWEAFTAGDQTKARLHKAYKDLGMYAERIIQAAFESNGFGKWKADKASTIARKGSSMTLIDTSQLRASITSDVVAK